LTITLITVSFHAVLLNIIESIYFITYNIIINESVDAVKDLIVQIHLLLVN